MLFSDKIKSVISKTFYDKTVEVLEITTALDEEGGAVRELSKIGEIRANIQPQSHLLQLEERGLVQDCDMIMTCAPGVRLNTQSKIRFDDIEYQVVELLQYESHSKVMLKKWQK